MNRIQFLNALSDYHTSFHEENAFIPRFKSLLINFQNCYKRTLLTGHVTASAWIVDEKGTAALLVHHKKLNRWLQPGGHADGDEDIISVARKEAYEETGLRSLKLYNNQIFDIDMHLIPPRKEIKAHFHHDIRFLFIGDIKENFTVSEESNELSWIPLKKMQEFVGNNISIHRMVLKTNSIFK